MRKHIIFALASSIILSACAFGNEYDANSQPSGVVISFGVEPSMLSSYTPIIARFNAQHPEIHVQTVELTDASGSPIEIAQNIARAADVSLASGFQTSEVWDSNLLLDLRPFFEPDATFQPADYYPGVIEQASYHGRVYSLPLQMHVPLLQYNKRLWDEAKLPAPAPGQSWQALLDAAAQLAHTRPDGTHVYGIAAGANGSDLFLALLGEQGINPYGEQTLPFESDKVAQVLTRVRQLVRDGVVYAGPAGDELITTQQVAIWPELHYNSTLNHDTRTFEFGTMPIPTTYFSDDIPLEPSLVISAGTQHPQEAWKLLSFLTHTLPEADYSAVSPAVREIPVRRSLVEQQQTWQQMESDPEARAALQFALGRPFPVSFVPSISPGRYQTLYSLVNGVVEDNLPIAEAAARAKEAGAETDASWPTPPPTSGPFTVNTPLPETRNPLAERVVFSAAGLDSAKLQPLARAFGEQHADLEIVLDDSATPPDCFAQPAALADPGQKLLDLQPFADADQRFQQGDIPAAWWSPYRRGGTLTGVPLAVLVRWVGYAQPIAAAHPTAKLGGDWSLETLPATVEQLSQTPAKPAIYGSLDPSPKYTIPFFLGRFQASLWRTEQGRQVPNFTDPQVAKALRAYIDFLAAGQPASAAPAALDSAAIQQLVNQQQVGLWFEFAPIPAHLADSEIGVAAPPFGAQGLAADDFIVFGLHISAESSHQQACWQWISWLSQQREALPLGLLPARRSQATDPALAQQLGADTAALFARYADLAQQPLASTASNLLLDSYQSHWLLEAVGDAQRGQPLDTALEQAQQTTEAYLECRDTAASEETCAKQADPSFQQEDR